MAEYTYGLCVGLSCGEHEGLMVAAGTASATGMVASHCINALRDGLDAFYA